MGPKATHEERLRTNYSRVGVAVMQALYNSDYLSVGGTASTDDLGRRAGVSVGSTVLDVGCGVGGPMLHLAGSIGCTVWGLDLIESSIEQARLRATELELDDLATFQQGDATRLPFGDDSFDFVWGQDAWCHVPDKAALLAEAARVLRPGGRIAFTDWLAGNGLTPTERRAALEAAVSESAASAKEYQGLLLGAGFVDIEHTDIGPELTEHYKEICVRLQENRQELSERFSERVYDIVAETNGTVLHGFESGAIGGGRFLATLPGV